MSIVFEHANNVLLCHSTFINNIYETNANLNDEPSASGDQKLSIKINECIFDLNIPFSRKTFDDSSKHRKAKRKKANIAANENRELQDVVRYK